MEARCPRCSTVFTTDRSGIQFCPNCGQQVDVPEPSVRPPGQEPWGQPAAGGGRFTGEPPPGGSGGYPGGGRELTPWERRKELGAFQGFFETWKRSVFSPQTFFPSVRPDVPWTEALFYAWIIYAITVLVGLPFVGLGLVRPIPGNLDDPQMENAIRAFSGGAGIGALLVTLLLYPLVILAGAGIIHLVAMLFGAASNGYGATVRALCYAAGPHLFGIVPCFGILASIYAVVLSIFGIASLQQTSLGKASGIVLLPFVVLVCCCGFLASAFIATIAGLVSGMGTGATQSL